MIDAANEALSFMAGRSLEDLRCDRMLALSVVKELEIIGEAAARLSDAAKAGAPGVPWPMIIAMRNRLIHAYFEIDVEIVWTTVTNSLPKLLFALSHLI